VIADRHIYLVYHIKQYDFVFRQFLTAAQTHTFDTSIPDFHKYYIMFVQIIPYCPGQKTSALQAKHLLQFCGIIVSGAKLIGTLLSKKPAQRELKIIKMLL